METPNLPSSDYTPNHRNKYLHSSQLISPITSSLPLVEPALNATTTYYLTQNKSNKKSRAMLINTYQNSAKGSLNRQLDVDSRAPHFASQTMVPLKNQQVDEQEQHLMEKETSFKKKHNSTMQDRLHSNTMKNMALIQKQIQANTNMTRNRLAASKASNQTTSHLASVRSQTVHMNSRKEPDTGNQSFYRLTAASQNRDQSGGWHDGASTQIGEQLHQHQLIEIESPNINFQPLQLGGQVSSFKNQKVAAKKRNDIGLSIENYTSRQSNFLSNPTGRFNDMRRKVAGSHMGKTNSSMFAEGKSHKAISDLQKDAISLNTQSQRRQRNLMELSLQQQIVENTLDDEEGLQTRSLHSIDQTAKKKKPITYKIIHDQESSFLDTQLELPPTSLTPLKQLDTQLQQSQMLACAELDGKRMASNITEIQNSITEQSQSQHMQQIQAQLNDVSTMMSQTSKLTNSKLLGNRQVECPQCRTWKRINQECRNFQLRANYKDLNCVFKLVEDLAQIESIQKMAPELSRSLIALKDNFKSQYELEKSELDAKVFMLENKLKLVNEINEKYKNDLEALQVKYDGINDFIYDSRTVTIKKDANHQAFLKDQTIKDGVVDDALDKQAKVKYSALDTELSHLQESVDMQKDHHNETLNMLHNRLAAEKRNRALHIHIEDIFDREATLQSNQVSTFMREHFRCGKDAATMTFNKASVTSENMISLQTGYPSKAERVREDMEVRRLENMTTVKIENSLMCQQNLELNQTIIDLRQYQIGIEKQLIEFKDLDMDKVRKAQSDYRRVSDENERITKTFQICDEQRHKLVKDTRRFIIYEEHYKASINYSLEFSNDVLKQLAELRREITCEEIIEDNELLEVEVNKIIRTEVNATLTGPPPGSKTVTNIFKGHIAEQRSIVNQSIEMIQRVISLAYTYNRPLLASKQAMEEVFRLQKSQLHGELKAKFDQLFADREKEYSKIKDNMEEQLNTANEELKEAEKKNNQTAEALRKMKIELKNAGQETTRRVASAAKKNKAPIRQAVIVKDEQLHVPLVQPQRPKIASIESESSRENLQPPQINEPKREKSFNSSNSPAKKASSKKRLIQESKIPAKKKKSEPIMNKTPSKKMTKRSVVEVSAIPEENQIGDEAPSIQQRQKNSTASMAGTWTDGTKHHDNIDEEEESKMMNYVSDMRTVTQKSTIQSQDVASQRQVTPHSNQLATMAEQCHFSSVPVLEPDDPKDYINIDKFEKSRDSTSLDCAPELQVNSQIVDLDEDQNLSEGTLSQETSIINLHQQQPPSEKSESRESRESGVSRKPQEVMSLIRPAIEQDSAKGFSSTVLLEMNPYHSLLQHNTSLDEASSEIPTPKIMKAARNKSEPDNNDTTPRLGEPLKQAALGQTQYAPRDSTDLKIVEIIHPVLNSKPQLPGDVQIVLSSRDQSTNQQLIEQKVATPAVMSKTDQMSQVQQTEEIQQVSAATQVSQAAEKCDKRIEIDGVVFENDEGRKVRIQEMKDLEDKFKKNPQDKQVKKEYFAALKIEYGESPAVNPYAQPYKPITPRVQVTKSTSLNRDQLHSHQIRLQNMLIGQQDHKLASSVSPVRLTQVLNQSGVSLSKVALLGTQTAKNRQDYHLTHNSKQVQCDLLSSPFFKAPQKPRCIDKQVQTVEHKAESKARNNHEKKQRGTKMLSSSATPIQTSRQPASRRVTRNMMVQEQQTAGQVLQSRIFDKSFDVNRNCSRNKKRSYSPKLQEADSHHALEGGIWVQNAISILPASRNTGGIETANLTLASPVRHEDNSSKGSVRDSSSPVGLNFMFQPVLKMQGRTGRYSPRRQLTTEDIVEYQQTTEAIKFKKESVMLEIKTIEMKDKKIGILLDTNTVTGGATNVPTERTDD